MRHAFVCIGDTHLGLRTAGMDRRSEIIDIFREVVLEAELLQKNGYKTRLILGGDIFDDHDPDESLIAEFIKVLNMIHAADLKTDIMIGNHEVVPDPKRLSCLSFLRELKTVYPTIHFREKPITINPEGRLFVTYLPHVTRATLKHIGQLDAENKGPTTQEYIENYGRKVVEKIGEPLDGVHLVFSHLNVHGAHAGSEENLLKKSEAYLPMAFTNTPPGLLEPQIINFHIHEKQHIGNIRVVGSPLFCSFGETQDKTFTTITVEDGGEVNFTEKPTSFIPFLQLEVDMIGEQTDFLDREDVKELLAKAMAYVAKGNPPVIKFQVTINAENNTYNWQQVARTIEERTDPAVMLMPIETKVVQNRILRNIKQNANLDPKDAVQVYLKAHLKNDKEKMKRIYKKSKPYLGVV